MTEFELKLQSAARLAAKGKVSRRDFVQLALAAGLTATAANAMFVQAVRAEPKKGGTLKIGIGDAVATDSLDPVFYASAFTNIALWGTLSNSLTEIDAKGNVVPDLAESFEPSDGAKKWVFKLRKGATFHNGKTVTADDVVASVRHHTIEGTESNPKELLASIKSMVADGAETVVFELDGGNADFPYIMSDIPIMPAKEGGVDWESGIRTGPYMLEKFEPGVIATLNKNPNYFKSDKGWFDRVECLAIVDVTARTNALNTGEVHYMDRCDLKTLDLLKQNPDLVISETTGYGHYSYLMNVQKAPFDNPDVRNALKYSLKRDEIVDKVFLGHGAVGNDNPIAPAVKFAIDPQPKHTYDPDMVKSLLKKAGAENVQFDLSVADAGFTGATDSALLWQEHARAAGPQPECHQGAQRRLLGQCLAQEAVLRLLSGPGARPATGCSPSPMRRRRRGTLRPGRIPASTNSSSPPGRRPTTPSAPACMPKCSNCCMTTAGSSTSSSTPMSMPTPRLSPMASWRRTGRWTGGRSPSAGGSPDLTSRALAPPNLTLSRRCEG